MNLRIVIKRIFIGEEMRKYPRIIYGYDLRETQYMCKQFMKDNPTAKVKRVGQCEFKFEVNGEETWIMHHTHYEEWCKGRTYYIDNVLYHSGYMIKEVSDEITD